MDKLEIDDQLTILNRSMEYRISKEKLTRKIPYFEKMLNHDFKESKENKIVLDFDERAIEAIFDWIKIGRVSIKMDYVIALCDILDYFGLPDSFITPRVTYFHNNFTIAHLPVVIPQVTSTSKLINLSSLNAFICRYFTKIANTKVWLNYPLETIEYICKLDLMVHSEMQVFEAIMGWLNVKCDSRKCHLERLLKLIRWCHLKGEDLSKIMENELVKSLEFNPKFCSNDKGNCDCDLNRTEQEYFVMIEAPYEVPNGIRITILANNLNPLFNRILKLDESLPERIIHDAHISDIHVRPGSEWKIIRIDWKHNKYRWLDFSAYSCKLLESIDISLDQNNGESFMVKLPGIINYEFGHTLLEAKDKFILISKDKDSLYYWSQPTAEKVRHLNPFFVYYYIAPKITVLDNKIYVLTKDLEFIEFDIDRNFEFKMFELPRSKKYRYLSSLDLTSKQTNDDRIILFDGSEKSVYRFNVNTQQWSSSGRIINCNFSDYLKKTKEMNFTSAFLSVDIMSFA